MSVKIDLDQLADALADFTFGDRAPRSTAPRKIGFQKSEGSVAAGRS
jgi:hypothetical protein